jgi:NAD(P)-dependent dehydrogenase (short-subunit alcohol dehydrogenase family)
MLDPRTLHPKPPFSTPKLNFPGLESEVNPRPDYGKDSYEGSSKLLGKVAIITGGDSGIGRATAYAFACEGASVVLSYLPQEESDAQEIKKAIEEIGQKVLLIPGDIQLESVCQKIVTQTIETFGKLDIVINNAAYQMSLPELDDITEEELDRTFRTNIYAMFYFAKAAWQYLQPGSTIINTTSIQAYNPSPPLMPYAATKAAIVNFTKSLAEKAAEKGIRVNAIAPRPIWSPLNPMAMPEETVKKFGEQTWLKRPGQPVEVAKVFVFLASDDASYVTGHVYGVTGGMVMPC